MEQVSYVRLQNSGAAFNIERETFTCMKLRIPRNGKWMRDVIAYAEGILPNLNMGQANTSEQRTPDIVEIDNLSGIIAEMACRTILEWQYGDKRIRKPSVLTSLNQIDIRLDTERTIEVRSSCVRNGIQFAVFTRDKENPKQQYFDVIGPYSNGYKPGEQLKDYYMRALYHCDKKDFMSLLSQPVLELFITGGATKEMMCDSTVYQNKHLLPSGGQVWTESDYRVIPLGKSLDVKQFFEILERENNLIQKRSDISETAI